MVYRFSVVLAICLVSIGSLAQESAPKPKVSNDPLTAEQVAIYRTVMKHYLKNAGTSVNLANTTAPFDFGNNSCVKGIELDDPHSSARWVHKLSASELDDARVVLVEQEQQMARITHNDPNYLIQAMAEGKQVSSEELNTLTQGAEVGVLILSEIALDKTRHAAVVSETFYCGRLCGHGETVILRKAGHEWKIKRACGGWVS